MKLGSPEAMRQEPSNHAWEEREAERDVAEQRNADKIDGYDRDDLGLSPDYEEWDDQYGDN